MGIRELTMSYTRATLIYPNQSVAAPLLERRGSDGRRTPGYVSRGLLSPHSGQQRNGGQPGGVACNAPFEVVIHDDRFWTRANR
ncbi:hypothetical protein HISP_17216 [Haloarcula hispanica N601]|uniref:Uncharacterized protein n=1 Tax=Haloarcula hispanica N601 TaxID=1417673 RepID=W0GGR4_HALHI|nr:hypothetical protein HISP_17216 [Haloarcula hispanica N601]